MPCLSGYNFFRFRRRSGAPTAACCWFLESDIQSPVWEIFQWVLGWFSDGLSLVWSGILTNWLENRRKGGFLVCGDRIRRGTDDFCEKFTEKIKIRQFPFSFFLPTLFLSLSRYFSISPFLFCSVFTYVHYFYLLYFLSIFSLFFPYVFLDLFFNFPPPILCIFVCLLLYVCV